MLIRTFKNAVIVGCSAILLSACATFHDSQIKSSVPIKQTASSLQTKSLGTVNFPVSCSKSSQAAMEQGLALLHHMMYTQAERVFTRLSESEPQCAMAYWGIAMTQFHPLWPGQTPEPALQKGAAAIASAQAANQATQRERDYIDAASAFYENWPNTPHAARIANWAEAQAALYQVYPDDLEAAVLYALSNLAIAAKADREFSRQKQSGALLESLYQDYPQHPGIIHYTIHAYDNPLLAERGVTAARAYDQIAPDVPHALHMPTHIFVRLGIWPDVIKWNRRSAAAALLYPVNGKVSHHYPHALDYQAYAYLQQGNDAQAYQVWMDLQENRNYQPSFVSGYVLAAVPARYYLERRQWQQAAELQTNTPANFPWEKFPELQAITYYAKGLGAARSGDIAVARQAEQTLTTLQQQTKAAGRDYWATLVEAQRLSVGAWIDWQQGKQQAALSQMQQAADLEDSVDKHPVTPGAVLPARELYGDMLVLAGQYPAAIAAYQQSLQISPNRFNSLYGAGYAADQAGNSEQARRYYSQLAQLTIGDAEPRPEIMQMKQFLAKQ